MRKALLVTAIFTLAYTVNGLASDSVGTQIGAVNYSTVSFTTSRVFINDGDTSFDGIIVSSVAQGDIGSYITITDTTTASGLTGSCAGCGIDEVYRVYLSSDTSGAGVGASYAIDSSGGLLNVQYKPPSPIRMKWGLAVKPSDGSVNQIRVLWRRLK